ncbi:serine/arginine repetitive matrix protein 2-like isoform X2 [Mizuhopecten yessoensis]|uniref:serine/arginine repetitive matrix protein 2-like isoform X2 n=1 Tax=Mizuhopecten yessoensis TaxID=6573 RepID=UPI000B45E059|nr:serine/arginine repetitive matrix protein 2-like isoform X2 [Mizuhopecten yessoensis]
MDDSGPSFPHGGHAPPQHWFDTWDNRGNQNTSSTALSAKGLRNAPGENNCFLNSAVQVFWHLDVFRRSYRRLTGHLCMGNSCIFCALKVIFTQFQYSDQASLPPDALRKALAESFINQQRFQLGHMDDAAECFENILRRIHFHIANAYSEDACQAPHCLPHQKFAMTVFDQIVCICGASSDPLTFHELVHYISTSALVSQCRSMHETGDILHPDRFGLLLRNAGAVGDIRDCPNSCGKRVQIRRTLLNCPDVVSIGLVWETDRPNTDMISDVVQSIGTTILLQDVFHSVMVKGMKDVSKLPKLQLSALVCYYGKHYSTFVFHTKLNAWIYFDDATVRQVGPSWDDVVEKCCKGHYQPLLLLYTNPNASPIATETAPKKRVMAPGFSTPVKVPAEKKTECRHDGVRRSITPNPDGPRAAVANSRRSTTPNPPNAAEPISSDTEPGVTKKQVEHHRQHSFLIAVTGKTGRAAEQNKSEYAVPMNNTAVKHRLPGGQGQTSASEQRSSGRKHRPSDLQLPRPEDSVDDYNYTLSTRDQYRRPSISSPDHTGKPLTPNFSRGEVPPRKDSFKKGKDKVPVDVIRYQVPRTSSTSSDSDSVGHSDHSPANSKPGSNQSAAPVLPPKHRRTRSICHEDAPQNLSADHIDMRQHVVMKPKPSAGHNYENIENIAHTPVQSGLATLPRNKKGKSAQQMPQGDKASRPSLHNRQGTQAQPGQMDRVFHSRQNSVSGQSAHSRESSTHTLTDDRHSRQSSMVSQISEAMSSASQQQGNTHADKPSSQSPPDSHSRKEQTKPSVPINKPPKPAKPEKKPTVSQKKTPNPPPPPTRKSELRDNREDKINYINRNMVESVLHYQSQKLTRQGSNISSVSQSSNTSFDSDNSSVRSHKDSTTEILFDTLSLDSAQRDSGYGSSDRNSSSSTGSTTLDPYAQYFMSKSMIPPKNINPHGVAENLKKFINHGYEGDRNYGPTTYTVGSVQHGSQATVQQTGQQYPPPDDKYNPDLNYGHSKTGVETGKSLYPVVDNSHMSVQPTDQNVERKPLYDPAIVKSHTQGKGNQVYPVTQKMMPQEVKSAPGNKSGPEGFGRVPNQKSEKPSMYHEGADEYMKFCQKAEELMDQCVLVETSENGSMALNYCNAAIDCLKQAMRINSLSQQSFVSAQKMHNSCVLKSRSLQKKFLVRQESMSSTTSSDSARSSPCPISVSSDHSSSSSHSYGENCVQQNVLISKLQQNSIHSRSSSRDSVDSVIENKNYRKENRTIVKPEKPCSESTSNSSLNSNERTSYNQYESDPTADMYATLPRKGTRRSQKGSVSSNSESEVYKDFLNKQRSVNGNGNPNGRTASSGSITPTPNDSCFDTDSSLTDGNDLHYKMQVPSQQQVKANRAEIRQLPHNNNGSGSYNPQGYYPSGYTSSRHQDSQQSYPHPQSAHPTQHQHEDHRQGCGEHYGENQITSRQSATTTQCTNADEGCSEPEEFRPSVSVRDLASRFEGSRSNGTSCSNSRDHQQDNAQLPPSGNLGRQRSKSESDFRTLDVKPKSVLSRNKQKNKVNRMKKSVTFNDNVALVDLMDMFAPPEGAPGYNDNNSGYVSDQEERYDTTVRSYSDNELDDDDDDSVDSPTEIAPGEVSCSLCGKHGAQNGGQYCEKCHHYLGQFQQRRC